MEPTKQGCGSGARPALRTPPSGAGLTSAPTPAVCDASHRSWSVEVAGDDEAEGALREKARWYLDAGVEVVWLVLPDSREVVVLTSAEQRRYRSGETLPAQSTLPDLAPRVEDFFLQLSAG